MKVWLHLPGRIEEKAETLVKYEEDHLLCVTMTPLPPWWYEIDATAPANPARVILALRREGDHYIEPTLNNVEFCVVRE